MDSKTSGLVISSIAFILAKTTIFNQFGRVANDNHYVFNLIAMLKTTAEILIENLYSVFDVQMSTILCTIIYFDRLIKLKTNIHMENFREYLIGCLVIAVKFNEESQLSLKVWGCSRLGLYNVEIIEFEVLRFLDYNLYISKQEYENYNSIITKFSSLMLSRDELNSEFLMNYKYEYGRYSYDKHDKRFNHCFEYNKFDNDFYFDRKVFNNNKENTNDCNDCHQQNNNNTSNYEVYLSNSINNKNININGIHLYNPHNFMYNSLDIIDSVLSPSAITGLSPLGKVLENYYEEGVKRTSEEEVELFQNTFRTYNSNTIANNNTNPSNLSLIQSI